MGGPQQNDGTDGTDAQVNVADPGTDVAAVLLMQGTDNGAAADSGERAAESDPASAMQQVEAPAAEGLTAALTGWFSADVSEGWDGPAALIGEQDGELAGRQLDESFLMALDHLFARESRLIIGSLLVPLCWFAGSVLLEGRRRKALADRPCQKA
jgi:hypothetical protein